MCSREMKDLVQVMRKEGMENVTFAGHIEWSIE